MPAKTPPNLVPAKRRGWLRRIARWGMWVLLALIVFHRPLLHFAIRRVAIWGAAREHMVLDLRVGGNVWSKLELRDVSIRADGKGPAPVERLRLDRAVIEYDIRKALHSDWRHLLRTVEIGTLDGLIALHKSGPLAQKLQNILADSLAPVQHLSAKRVNFAVKDVTTISGLQAEVTRGQPGHIAWEKIHVVGLPNIESASAELAMNETTFAISKLPLFPEVVVRRLSLNRVTPTLPRGGLEFFAEAGGGTMGLRVEPSLTPGALDGAVDIEAVRLNEIARRFEIELPAPAAIDGFHARFTGTPEQIEASMADVNFAFRLDEKDDIPAATMRGEAKWGHGVFRISELTASASGVDLRIGGEVTVPLAHGFAFSKLRGEITWKLVGSDLATLRLRDIAGLRGALTGAGKLQFANGEAWTVGDIAAMKFSRENVRVDAGTVHFDARRKLETFRDFLATLTANLSLEVKGVAIGGIRLEGMTAKAKLDGPRAEIEQFSVSSGENRITGSGRVTLKPAAAGLATAPEMDVLIAAPKLQEFGVAVNGAVLSGALAAEGKLRLEGTRLAGNLRADGTDLHLGKTPLGGFRAQVKFEEGAAILETLNVNLAGAGEITAAGRAALESPMAYSGEVHANLAALGKLDAVLTTAGHPMKLGGALRLDWTGEGSLSENAHSGKLSVTGKDVRHDSLVLNQVRLGAAYSPRQLATTELLVIADKTNIGGRIRWKDNRLDLSDFAIAIAGEQAVTGTASIPFHPANPKNLMPNDQPIRAQLAGTNVDIAKLLSNLGRKGVLVSGRVSGDLAASGTFSKPELTLNVAGRSLKTPAAASLAPAEFDAKLIMHDSRVTLDAVAKQPDIQPLTVAASLPLDLEKLRAHPELARQTPVEVLVKLPATSLGIVTRFVPAIARLDGTVVANVEVRGTVAKPVMSGEATIAAKSVRLTSARVAPFSNVRARLVFRDDRITLHDARGETGGGSFTVDGSVNLAKLQPVLDLRLRSNKVLVLRDESITVRADTDVTVRGPLNSATAAGTVFVTQSRFLKDVDILPLTLPGKPVPQVRNVAAPLRVSFPNPPLRDWKFDVAIKTREKDSFLVRGNLAKGSSTMDLRFRGTGLNPYLDGVMQVENFTAILPVSKLEVESGYVTFSESEPFVPQLQLQAQSKIGKNTVYATITGPAGSPHLELESEPPLPDRDILSLLATGTTSGELGSNASALATKVGLLKVKRWYRKAFRKDAADPSAEEQDSFVNRLDLDISNVNAKTGRPDVEASYRINDNFYILGEVDMEGQATGKVKYLLRFR